MTSRTRDAEARSSESLSEDEADLYMAEGVQKRKRSSNRPSEPSNSKSPATAQGRPGSLEWILKSDKSPLCNIMLKNIINEDTWVSCLTNEDRQVLSSLLPPTINPSFKPILPPYHPSRPKDVEDDQDKEQRTAPVTDTFEADANSFMKLPSFEAALTSFRDDLYTGRFSTAHIKRIEKFSSGVTSGKLHAPWKDEAWGQAQRQEDERGSSQRRVRKDLAKMHHLQIIRTSDILSYRCYFPMQEITVEKDVLVDGGSAHGLSVVAPGGQESHLPLGMLLETPIPPSGASLQQMFIQSPEELEQAILDMDGRIPPETQRKTDSWKRFSLWRWSPGQQSEAGSWDVEFGNMGTRGTRENRGTLFYLRGAF